MIVARIRACGTNESHIGATIIIWEIARGRTRCRWGEDCGKIRDIRCEKRIGSPMSSEGEVKYLDGGGGVVGVVGGGHLHVYMDSF